MFLETYKRILIPRFLRISSIHSRIIDEGLRAFLTFDSLPENAVLLGQRPPVPLQVVPGLLWDGVALLADLETAPWHAKGNQQHTLHFLTKQTPRPIQTTL